MDGARASYVRAGVLFHWLAVPSARPARIAAAYLAALTIAEVISTFGHPQLGAASHALLMLVLMYHAARDLGDPLHRLLLALALAPLIRLISYSLPLAGFPQIAWYAIISVPLFVAAFFARRVLGYTLAEIGLHRQGLPIQLLIGMTGITFGYVEYRILTPDPLAASFTLADLWLPALVLLISTGFLEELIFRGLMQRAGAEALQWKGLIYVSLVFAVLHLGYKSVLDMVFVFGVALFFGWVVNRTGNLLGVILAHGLTNVTLFLILPFLAAGAPLPV